MENTPKTIRAEWIGTEIIGYFVNTEFSEENKKKLELITKDLQSKIPDIVWPTPTDSLHITLFEIIGPFKNYGRDKNEIFNEIFEKYDNAIKNVLKDQKPIVIHFNELRVSPNAIIALGHDDGSFQKIRDAIVAEIPPLQGTSMPPNIIHSSLCRFLKVDDMQKVVDALKDSSISFDETVDHFRLTKELVPPLVKFELIENYPLKQD